MIKFYVHLFVSICIEPMLSCTDSIELKSLRRWGVKFFYIFLLIKVLERNLGVICYRFAVEFFDTLISFKMSAFINVGPVTSSNF